MGDAAASVCSALEFKMIRETKVTPVVGLQDNVIALTALSDHWFDIILHVPVPHRCLVKITRDVIASQAWQALGLSRVLCRSRGAWCWAQREHIGKDFRQGRQSPDVPADVVGHGT